MIFSLGLFQVLENPKTEDDRRMEFVPYIANLITRREAVMKTITLGANEPIVSTKLFNESRSNPNSRKRSSTATPNILQFKFLKSISLRLLQMKKKKLKYN